MIELFSFSTYGFKSFFFDPKFPYPGNDLILISFYFKILWDLLLEISETSILFNLPFIQP